MHHHILRGLLSSCALAVMISGAAQGQAAPATDDAAKTDLTTGIAEGSDILVTATRANRIAPVTASLQTTQPQSVISRSFIEDSLPATSDFNQIALIAPSVSGYGNANGPVTIEIPALGDGR